MVRALAVRKVGHLARHSTTVPGMEEPWYEKPFCNEETHKHNDRVINK